MSSGVLTGFECSRRYLDSILFHQRFNFAAGQ